MKFVNLEIRRKWAMFKAFFYKIHNTFIKKDEKSVLFVPHYNCKYDGYDILNGDSDNVLCLFNYMINDSRFYGFHFSLVYYHKDKIDEYKKYLSSYPDIQFSLIYKDRCSQFRRLFYKCSTIFTAETYALYPYKTKNQKVICLNYFGGLIKNEFHRWTKHGGYRRMLQEQDMVNRCYDYHLSLSDISSKFIALDNCIYYPKFLSLGFPRNDIFYTDQSFLRTQIEKLVNFNVKKILTYVPTHRDYENPLRKSFYNNNKIHTRTIWGQVAEEDYLQFEKNLIDSDVLIIAKIHPRQEKSLINSLKSSHILLYSDLVKHINTSLNPILAISDGIITDYTTTVYDYLHLNRPIIYYFYDIDDYRASRGFFIEPIESICAGHIVYNILELSNAIKEIADGKDSYQKKRQFIRELFLKNIDGFSSKRIVDFFFHRNI